MDAGVVLGVGSCSVFGSINCLLRLSGGCPRRERTVASLIACLRSIQTGSTSTRSQGEHASEACPVYWPLPASPGHS